LRFILTGGQVNDCTQALALLDGMTGKAVLADKAYDSRAILERIQKMQAVAVIPPTATRKIQREYDHQLYRQRNCIERTFRWLKQFRRIVPPVTTAKPTTSSQPCKSPPSLSGAEMNVDSP
jgi:transposase